MNICLSKERFQVSPSVDGFNMVRRMLKRFLKIYLAGTKANSCELIFHFLNCGFLPLGNPPFWIWLLGICPSKLFIKQAPLFEQQRLHESLA